MSKSFIIIFFILLLLSNLSYSNASTISAEWYLKVGNGIPYTAYMNQTGSNLSGYLQDSNGNHFVLKSGFVKQINSQKWTFQFKEGESKWSGIIIKSGNSYKIINGKVYNIYTGKFQAVFSGTVSVSSRKSQNPHLQNPYLSEKEIDLGGISLSYNISKVIKKYGKPISIKKETLKEYKPNIIIYTYKFKNGVIVRNNTAYNIIEAIEVTTPKFSTYRGVRVGHNLAYVKKMYGSNGSLYNDPQNKSYKYYSYSSFTGCIDLGFKINSSNKVISIFVTSYRC